MDKSVIVKFNNGEDYALISKMLKIVNVVSDGVNKQAYNVHNKRFDVTIYFEKELTEEDLKAKEKEIETLKSSINKRKALLANEGFVARAPQNLVEQEKMKLALEEEKLAKILG